MRAEIRPQRDPLSPGRDLPPASVERLVDALGMAWASYTLYGDPRDVEAFRRAVEGLGAAPGYPCRLYVGVDGFTDHGEPVPTRREGSIRIARHLFALGIASVELRSPPSGDDLLCLFGLCDMQHPPADPIGDLEERGVTTLRLLDREMLVATSSGADEEPAEQPRGRTTAVPQDGPGAFVMALLLDGAADPSEVARRFVDEYERAHLLVDEGDVWSAEELVRAFVDGFWYLPDEHRAAVFSLMLTRSDRDHNVAFLDQFGGLELAEMNRMFGEGGHPLLAEYLRVATREGGRHRDDLDELVSGPAAGPITRQIVGRVAEILHGDAADGSPPVEAALERLSSGLPTRAEEEETVARVLDGLFRLAEGPDGFAAAARIWARRVAAALEAGDPAAADTRLEVVAGLRPGDHERKLMLAELSDAMTGEALRVLAGVLTDPPEDGSGAAVRRAAPLFATGPLVRELGEENRMAGRKPLLRALQVVARARPAGLIPHLDDPRWYLVRNVVLALGHSGHVEIAPQLTRAAAHPEPRVRIEALRALYRLKGADAARVVLSAASDPDPAVAGEAGRLLGGFEDPELEEALVQRLERAKPAAAGPILTALTAMGTVTARSAVERIARSPFAWWGRSRRLRSAARKALETAGE